MIEALTIFLVIWVWCGLLLGLGAAVEWLGGMRSRTRKRR